MYFTEANICPSRLTLNIVFVFLTVFVFLVEQMDTNMLVNVYKDLAAAAILTQLVKVKIYNEY